MAIRPDPAFAERVMEGSIYEMRLYIYLDIILIEYVSKKISSCLLYFISHKKKNLNLKKKKKKKKIGVFSQLFD